ncbi:BadM/Rrf2 family transcriptional regulator [Neolewinella xylanilytica]|uniref:BadM/Rrf2 family transcriptional regulator n=1 Tax=Neolewinella xylanilytica TaxID=1514080 RepID=A0A2S6I4R0_9BACT|nr:Rrf2 family transcriptional regulator [Neolewinella xylanilytica]PPK86122.1 BadM/Rrf2 family transcriptional regulator [Neolewinella xylanilytica]
MNNGRFATALHLLTLLRLNRGELLSSDYMAGSVNVNPAVVRKELSNLRDHGLVTSKEGRGGGYSLGKPATQIHLSEVYQLVNDTHVLGRSNEPNPECPVGRQINGHLQELYCRADEALLNQLGQLTLEDFGRKLD